jgi:hypothetical protein
MPRGDQPSRHSDSPKLLLQIRDRLGVRAAGANLYEPAAEHLKIHNAPAEHRTMRWR